MSVLPVGFGSSGSVDTGDITKSLRFRSSGSTYLSRTFGTSTNDIKWAFSFWIKNGTMGVTNPIFSAGDGTASNYFSLERTSGNLLRVVVVYGGVTTLDCSTTAVFRDPTGHTQFLLYFDSANATSTDRLQLWQAGDGSNQSGKRLTLTYATGPIGINEPSIASWSAVVHYIGRLRYTATYGDMYLSRICFFDNSLPAMTALGYYNTEINEWVPKTRSEVKSVVDAAGASSFMLEFEDGTSLTTLGNDYSAKNNDWTLTNHSLTAGVTYDWMEDRPGNSYAVMSPIDKASNTTLSDANLKTENTNALTYSTCKTSAAFDVGSATGFTWEVLVNSVQNTLYAVIGACPTTQAPTGSYTASGVVAMTASGAVYKAGVLQGTYLSWTTSDIIKFWMGSGNLYYSVNGVSANSGNAVATGLSGDYVAADFRASSTAATCSWIYNFGQYPFATGATYHNAAGGYFRYAPPTGFLALCQANLPEGAVRNPKKHFDVVTRVGTGANYTKTGLHLAPDLIWSKSRGVSRSHSVVDSVRGSASQLASNTTDAQNTATDSVTAFNADGYSLGINVQTAPSINENTLTYVDWLWKANGAAVSNTNGTITSQVSANQTAGFSIVTYTGTGANATVGHGLGVAPKLVIVKARTGSGYSWITWHSAIAGTEFLYLDLTNAKATDTTRWNSTVPSSSLVSVGTSIGTNENTRTYVAYCFTDVPGYQKIGSVVANATADNAYADTGFKIGLLLIKCSSTTGNWVLIDATRQPYNVQGPVLLANSAGAESAQTYIDFTSRGFKIRSSGADIGAAQTYVYLAIASVNGKYSNGV